MYKERKYLLWRHETALGNGASHAIAISKHLQENPFDNAQVYVETGFQYAFATCIPKIKNKNVIVIDSNKCDTTKIESILKVYPDLIIPSVYKNNSIKNKTYAADWSDTKGGELNFPYELYNNDLDLPRNCIVIQIREKGTFNKRVDGAFSEPERFVNPQTYFDVALHFAELGHKIVRIGDSNQTPMPIHNNIIDLPKLGFITKNIMNDLWLIKNCKVFLSSDSGLWPMAGGFKTNLVLSNVIGKHYTDWLPKETSTVLFKENGIENTFKQLVQSIEKYI